MKHIVLFMYILIFSTGFASLVGLFVVAKRISGSFIKRMFFVQSIFIMNLAIVVAYYYVVHIIGLIGNNEHAENIFGVLSTLFNGALYIGIIWLVHDPKLKKPHTLSYKLSIIGSMCICIFLIGKLIGVTILPQTWFGSFTQTPLWTITQYVLITTTMACVGILFTKAPKKYDHKAYHVLLAGIGICFIGFVPLSILEYVFAYSIALDYRPLSLEYVMYIGINMCILVSTIQVLQTHSKGETSLATFSEEIFSRYSLTKREREIVLFIAKGLSNKEIATAIHISEATVRTHIYNIFQKANVQSRIELLNVLHT